MEPLLIEMFEQARKLVSEADRKLAEEEERRREKEREASLMGFSGRVEAAFDFTSKEKLELDPRLDIQDGKPLVELVVRSLRAIFILAPQTDDMWTLTLLDDGREPQLLAEIKAGTKSDSGSRRLAAARIVTSIGNWSQEIASTKRPVAVQSRWSDRVEPIIDKREPEKRESEKREPTYGTFGKFLGY
jgi:hypothetical protein